MSGAPSPGLSRQGTRAGRAASPCFAAHLETPPIESLVREVVMPTREETHENLKLSHPQRQTSISIAINTTITTTSIVTIIVK